MAANKGGDNNHVDIDCRVEVLDEASEFFWEEQMNSSNISKMRSLDLFSITTTKDLKIQKGVSDVYPKMHMLKA